MTKQSSSEQADVWTVGWVIRALVLITFLAAFLVPMGSVPIIAVGSQTDDVPVVSTGPITYRLSTPVPEVTTIPVTPTPDIIHIGIIIGHYGNDSGAVCDDGLQEVQVNTQIARYVEQMALAKGWQIDLLEEWDPRLDGYVADALLSIHADSCFPGKTGFKLARATSSYIPVEEDLLVQCVSEHYQAVTGLEFDANTITHDMTDYHALYEIHPNTPAAIIETGFMLNDRALLTERPQIVAQGIIDGLVCFLEGEQ